MRRLGPKFWGLTAIRPKSAATLGLLLIAAIVICAGGLSFSHAVPEKVALTKGPPSQAFHRQAPPAPADMQATLQRIAAGYGEPVGIAVSEVAQGWTAAIAGDETFPQQSVSKLWVALSVMQAVDDGRLSLDQMVSMGPEDRSVFYQPLASRIRTSRPLEISIAELMRHALIESDNAANDKLIQQVGGPGVVTKTIADKGLQGLAVGGTERDVQTQTAGLAWRREYGVTWSFKQARAALPDEVRDRALATYLADPPDGATPDGIVTALAELKRGKLLSPASSAFMLDLMTQARTGQLRLRAAVVPGWSLAHKTGTGPDWRGASVGINDVGLLSAPDGRTFAIAVMIRQTHQGPSARHRLMQSVARAVESYWQASAVPESRQAHAETGTQPGI